MDANLQKQEEKKEEQIQLVEQENVQEERQEYINPYADVTEEEKQREQELTVNRLDEVFKKNETRVIRCKKIENTSKVKSVRRVVKKHWLKKDETVTKSYHVFGTSESRYKNRSANADALEQGINIVKDFKADYRRNTDIKVKATVGYQAFRQLSQFYAEFASEGTDAFNAMVEKYGKNETSAGRFEVMDKLTEKIMDINPEEFDFSSDKAIAGQAHKFENMSSMVESYRELIEDNPAYEQHLKETKVGDAGQNFYAKLAKQMEKLTAMSDYYRIRKMIISDTEYKIRGGKIEQRFTRNDSKGTTHLKEMLRASYFLAKNLNRVLGNNDVEGLDLIASKHCAEQDKVFDIKAQDIPAEGASEYVLNREKAIRDELDRLQREGDSVAAYNIRDCLGSLTDITKTVPDEKDLRKKKKVNQLSGLCAVYGGFSAQFQETYMDRSLKEKEKTHHKLQERILKLKDRFVNDMFGEAKFDSEKYPELKTMSVSDNISRMVQKIALDLSSDASDSEILEYIENQVIQNTKRYNTLQNNKTVIDEKKKKNEPLTADEEKLEVLSRDEYEYAQEAYIDASMRSIYRNNALFEQLEQALGSKVILLHPADMMVKLPEEVESLLNVTTAASNIIARPDYTVREFIKKYNKDYKRNKYKVDADKFFECADLYASVTFELTSTTRLISGYMEYLYKKLKGVEDEEDDDDDNVKDTMTKEEFNTIYKTIGTMGIKAEDVDSCYDENKNSDFVRKDLRRVPTWSEDRKKIVTYVHFHPECIDTKLLKFMDNISLGTTNLCKPDEAVRRAVRNGYLKDLSYEQLKAYEEDLKRRKMPPCNRDKDGNLLDVSDPYGLNVFYEELERKRIQAQAPDEQNNAGEVAAPVNILELNGDALKQAAKTELLDIRKKAGEKTELMEQGQRPEVDIKVFDDGTQLGLESVVQKQRSTETIPESKYKNNFNEADELYTNKKGHTLADRINKYTNVEDDVIKLFLTNDIDFINNNQQLINNAEKKFSGFAEYMKNRKQLLTYIKQRKSNHETNMFLKGNDGNTLDIRTLNDKNYVKDIYSKENYFSLGGVLYTGQQTTKGCSFAATLSMQLKARGIEVPEGYIKLYRRDGMNFADMQREKTGTNTEQDVINYTELVNKLIPGAATHEVKVEADRDIEALIRSEMQSKIESLDLKYTDDELEAMVMRQLKVDPRMKKNRDANIEYLRRSIIDGIVKHKSPITAKFDDRYITIFGIEGNKVKYYDSLSPTKNGVKIDSLDNLYRDEAQLVWFEEFEMNKTRNKTNAKAEKSTSKASYNEAGILQGQNKVRINPNSETIGVEADKSVETNLEAMKKDKFLDDNESIRVEEIIYLPKKMQVKADKE